MNVHRNAKLTPGGRALLVERLLAGELQARRIFTRPNGNSNERRVQLRPFLNY